MTKVRWGVLSTARIGLEKVIPAIQRGEFSQVVAIASRCLDKAQTAAKSLGIPKAYGSYDELLADPDVDAVYIPLPNHLHIPWSIKALKAGKHVLCEKPIGLNAAEACDLLQIARQHPGLKVMEAFMYRYHPQMKLVYQLIKDGAIGELRTIQSFFSFYLVDPLDIRNVSEAGGGGLLDIGCYLISLSRFIFEKEPERVLAIIENDPVLKIDRLASGILDFGIGTATFTCSTQIAPYQRINIFGTHGRIEIDLPFDAPPDHPCKIWVQTDQKTRKMLSEISNQYTVQGDIFSLAVLHDTQLPTTLEESIANMEVIDKLKHSAEINSWVTIINL